MGATIARSAAQGVCVTHSGLASCASERIGATLRS